MRGPRPRARPRRAGTLRRRRRPRPVLNPPETLATHAPATIGGLKGTLMVPGPTALPPSVVAAGGRPILYHRSDEFTSLWAETLAALCRVFQTEGEVLVHAGSGSVAMASAVVNLARPGERVLVASCGSFGERWAEIAAAEGIGVRHVAGEWGRPVDPEAVASALADDPAIGVVLTTQCETSTGVVNDLPALRGAAGDRILVADAVSGLAVVDLPMDRWGVDVAVGGSQKGLMTPPGLGMVAVNDRALAWSQGHGAPGYALSWARTRAGQNQLPRRTAFTPPVTLVVQLHEALRLIEAEGLAQVYERHRALGRACRAAVAALGLAPLGPDDPEANVCTAFWNPEGVEGEAIPRLMKSRYGVEVAGGQGKLAGRVVRIGHCGWCAWPDILVAAGALELALVELGLPVEPGDGVRAVQRAIADAGPGRG
jgi:serine---pyruvate transaminase